MKLNPQNYEDWLELSQEEKDKIHLECWNAYEREGIGFAYTAAGRLAVSHSRKILDLAIGTYHGGEYLIHAYVADEDFKDCPPMLEEQFEGFRICWFPMSRR